jgi:hypothetical protein
MAGSPLARQLAPVGSCSGRPACGPVSFLAKESGRPQLRPESALLFSGWSRDLFGLIFLRQEPRNSRTLKRKRLNPMARRSNPGSRTTSSFSWSKRGSIQRTKQIINLFVDRGFLTMGSSASPIVLVVVVLVVGWDRSRCERLDGWTDGRRTTTTIGATSAYGSIGGPEARFANGGSD